LEVGSDIAPHSEVLKRFPPVLVAMEPSFAMVQFDTAAAKEQFEVAAPSYPVVSMKVAHTVASLDRIALPSVVVRTLVLSVVVRIGRGAAVLVVLVLVVRTLVLSVVVRIGQGTAVQVVLVLVALPAKVDQIDRIVPLIAVRIASQTVPSVGRIVLQLVDQIVSLKGEIALVLSASDQCLLQW
jgi:hypothetical protein